MTEPLVPRSHNVPSPKPSTPRTPTKSLPHTPTKLAQHTSSVHATKAFPNARLSFSATSAGVPVCSLEPGSGLNADNVSDYLSTKKELLMRTYNEQGVLLLRGFPLEDWAVAEQAFILLTDHKPGGGPLGFLPVSLQNFLKEAILWVMMRLLDPGRKGGMRALAKATNNVQGPHQESSFLTWRMPIVGFFCETPPLKYGETAIYDAAAAYRALPDALKKTLRDYKFFYELYAGVIWTIVPRFVHSFVMWISYILFNQPGGWVPFLLRSPVSGDICLQWFGFGKRLNVHAASAFNRHYPGRGAIECVDYSGEMMVRPNKPGVPPRADEHLSDSEEAAITEAFFANSALIEWHEHDLALLDNVRWAHGRVNGEAPRMMHFFQAQPTIKIDDHKVV